MKQGQIRQQLTRTNAWWKSSRRGRWTADDPDLASTADAFDYRPNPLGALTTGGLYLLFGPRRVGKSVELKRLVEQLLNEEAEPRRIFHAACDTWIAGDLRQLIDVIDAMSPPNDGSRYVLLDEVTAIKEDWVAEIKWLRDNTSLKWDTVVLTGSSAERLAQARDELAGRRGKITDSDRTLLPMSFAAFCAAIGIELPQTPWIHPRNIFGSEAAEALSELEVYVDQLAPAWEQYLEIGGFPRAVEEWISDREVSDSFMNDLWDLVHGDALRNDWPQADTQRLFELLSKRLANPFNIAGASNELGVHRDVLALRLERLVQNFILWPCYRQGSDGRPKLAAFRKYYYLDPLYARLAAHRRDQDAPDTTVLSEQALGTALVCAHEEENPGHLTAYDAIMHFESASRKEIDFVGPSLGGIPYEGKYTELPTARETATAINAYGKAVLATRNVVERDPTRLAIPAAILALLLDPRPC